MCKGGRGMEVADTAFALKVSKERYHGQDTRPKTTYPNGQYICGGKVVEPTGTGLGKLLLSFYKKGSE